MNTPIIAQPIFQSDQARPARNGFPTVEFVFDQLRSAAEDVVLELLTWAAVTAIRQRDAVQALIRALLAQLYKLNRELDQSRQREAELRERLRALERREAA